MSFLCGCCVVRAQTNQCNARQIFIPSCYSFSSNKWEGSAPCFLVRLTVRFGQASMIVMFKDVAHNLKFDTYVFNSKDSEFNKKQQKTSKNEKKKTLCSIHSVMSRAVFSLY